MAEKEETFSEKSRDSPSSKLSCEKVKPESGKVKNYSSSETTVVNESAVPLSESADKVAQGQSISNLATKQMNNSNDMKDTANRKLTKAQLKREKRKVRKVNENDTNLKKNSAAQDIALQAKKNGPFPDDALRVDTEDPVYAEFKTVFDKFQSFDTANGVIDYNYRPAEELGGKGEIFYSDDEVPEEEEYSRRKKAEAAADGDGEEEGDDNSDEEESSKRLSRKKARKLGKVSVANLKTQVSRPDLVDWTDVDSKDPKLLVHLKSCRNTVPVPPHWSFKKDYLSSKKGVERPPFELPDFIRATGIMEMRDTGRDSQDQQSLRQKMRERVQPKMGRLDIDYQKLHDAFFKYQTKPPLSRYGDIYYEGKEWELNTRTKRPGELSDELKEALNMPPGAPPPWLLNMQRFGLPPSFPTMKIPGLNAPIPPGANWGFHPGGWGKPPVDEFNRPLFGGDLFGVIQTTQQEKQKPVEIDKTLWGQLEEVEESEGSEDEEEGSEAPDGAEMSLDDFDGETITDGLVTPSGMASSAPSEFEIPDHLDLRKEMAAGADDGEEDGDEDRHLYRVLKEEKRRVGRGGLMGSEHGYNISDIKRR